MSHLLTDHAIVLKRFNFGEADKIITVLTRSYGKLSLIAKGVRRITSKRKGHLELFNHVHISFTEPHSLGILTEAETTHHFDNLKNDWERMGQAYHVCEVVDKLLPEYEEQEYVFRLLIRILEVLNDENKDKKREETVRIFEQTLLQKLGFWDEKALGTQTILSPQEQKHLHLCYIQDIIEKELKSERIFREAKE